MQTIETTSVRAMFYAFKTRISYILDQSHWQHPRIVESALIGVLLIATPSLQAQSSNTGDIRGTVTDSSGAVIPGVAVTITNVLSGVVTSNSTNRVGLYDAISLLPGSYNLQFTKDGFQTFVRTGVTLGGDPISVNAKLSVGSQSEEVTVSGAIAAIDTESGQQSQTITEKQITELPSAGMNWENTTQLLPSTSAGGGSGVQIEGVQAYQTNFLINGGGAVLPASQNITRPTPFDAISEVQALSSNFSAEYGNGSSVINVITKSGTNQWHGSLYEFNQNDFTDAKNYFLPQGQRNTRVRWNLFGGSVGGPVLHNKLFFFFAYQRNPTGNQQLEQLTVPNAAVRSGDFSDPSFGTIYDPDTLTRNAAGQYVRTAFPNNKIPSSRLSPVAVALQKFLPMPNAAPLYNGYYGPFAANFRAAYSAPQSTTLYLGRIDYQINPGNRISGSFTYNPGIYSFNDLRCPANCYVQHDDQPSAQITYLSTPSPTLANEFRASYVAYRDQATAQGSGGGIAKTIGLQNAAYDALPTINFYSLDYFNGLNAGLEQREDEYTYTASDSLTYVHGKHIFKFGGQYDRLMNNSTPYANATGGNFYFDGSATRTPDLTKGQGYFLGGDGYADFLLGNVQNYGITINPETGYRSRDMQLFAQDDYKIAPTFTLNFGLRYTAVAGWSESHNNLGNFNPTAINPVTQTPGAFSVAGINGYPTALEKTQYNGIQPRFGFSWAPTPTWAIRGGYGIFDTILGIANYAPAYNFGVFGSTTATSISTDQIHPALNWNNPLPTATVIKESSFNTGTLNGQNIYYQPRNTPIPYVEQYSLSVQHQLPAGYSFEMAYVGTLGKHLTFGHDINQVPQALLGPGNAQINRPYPQYVQIFANTVDGYSNYNAGQFTLHKTPTHGYALNLTYSYSRTLDSGTGTGFNSYGGIDNWQYGGPALNYGRAYYDRPNLFKGDVIWYLPFGQGRLLLTHGKLMNAVVGGWEASSFFAISSGTPFTPEMGTANNSGALSGSWRPDRIGTGKLAHPTIQKWFNVADFRAPGPYTFGNSGRNNLVGPDYKNVDVSLSKNFALSLAKMDKMNLQIRVDAFNAFNHPNFGNPNASIGTAAAGTITYAGAPRTLQLGGRFSF